MDQLIRRAIAGRRLITFTYDNLARIAEPHVYGTKGGVVQMLVYQVGGQSRSGGLPNWRRVDVDRIVGLQIMDEIFAGPRQYPSGEHSIWDQRFLIVS